MRPQLPAIYNYVRVFEQPIPPTEVPNYVEDNDVNENDDDNSFLTEDNSFHTEETLDFSASSAQSENDIKPTFEQVRVGGADSNAFDALFVDSIEQPEMTDPFANSNNEPSEQCISGNALNASSSQTNDTHSHTSYATQSPEQHTSNSEAVTMVAGQKQFKVAIDDSLEMVYDSENDFRPFILDDGFQIKANDILSNNWPFKQNVRHSVQNVFCFWFTVLFITGKWRPSIQN